MAKPYQLGLGDYFNLSISYMKNADTKGVIGIYDSIAREIFGMGRVYACEADYVKPKTVVFNGAELPRCECVTYFTPDKKRGMRATISVDCLSPGELDASIETEKQAAINESIRQTSLVNNMPLPPVVRTIIEQQVNQRYAAIRESYVPTVKTAFLFIGSWAPGFNDDNLIFPDPGNEIKQSIGSFFGCDRITNGIENCVVFGSNDPLRFMLKTLFEDGRNGLSHDSKG